MALALEHDTACGTGGKDAITHLLHAFHLLHPPALSRSCRHMGMVHSALLVCPLLGEVSAAYVAWQAWASQPP